MCVCTRARVYDIRRTYTYFMLQKVSAKDKDILKVTTYVYGTGAYNISLYLFNESLFVRCTLLITYKYFYLY